MKMSLSSRRKYVAVARERYGGAKARTEKSRILDDVVATLGCHRKHAVRLLSPRA